MFWDGFSRRASFGEVADVYVGSNRVQWAGIDGQRGYVPIKGAGELFETVRFALRNIAPRRPLKTRLWLSGSICPAILEMPIAGIERDEERIRIIQAHMVQEGWFHEPPLVWLEAATPHRPRLAAAFDGPLLQALAKALGELKLKVQSIRPWWSDPLRVFATQADGKEARVLAVADGDSLTVIAGSKAGYTRAATTACATRDDALREWQRLRIGLQASPAPSHCAWYLNPGAADMPVSGELAQIAFAGCTGPLQ
ncbi:MAG: hypothetical protein LBV29_01970 [Azoarcus sp.]|nr:hypothetical protein [Azoarcus sp.]